MGACCEIAIFWDSSVAFGKNEGEKWAAEMSCEEAEEREGRKSIKVYVWKMKSKQRENDCIADEFSSDNCSSRTERRETGKAG